MSDRLAMATGGISQYHISLTHPHTLLARACLGVLLPDPDVTNRADPLTPYAAKHWVTHAQVEDVPSRVRDGMERLFDSHTHFEAWVQLYDPDRYAYPYAKQSERPGDRPLYYAALCGFHELVGHLLSKFPQCAGAQGGRRGTALHSASFAGHLQIVRTLLLYSVNVDIRGNEQYTPLLYASQYGHRGIVQYLIERGADVNVWLEGHDTPLILAAYRGHVDIVRMLLQHGADVDFHGFHGDTPLHAAVLGSHDTHKEVYPHFVRLLLERDSEVEATDKEGRIGIGDQTGRDRAVTFRISFWASTNIEYHDFLDYDRTTAVTHAVLYCNAALGYASGNYDNTHCRRQRENRNFDHFVIAHNLHKVEFSYLDA